MATPAQIAANRANGKKGGRKPGFNSKEQRIRDKATTMGRNALADVTKFWCDLIQDNVEGASVADRMRAAENLADRFGLPRKTDHDITGEGIATKQFLFVEKFVGDVKVEVETNGHTPP